LVKFTEITYSVLEDRVASGIAKNSWFLELEKSMAATTEAVVTAEPAYVILQVIF
jgi:hypothetical protein